VTATVRPESARLALTLARTVRDATVRETRAAMSGFPRRARGVPCDGARPTAFDPLDPGVLAEPHRWYRELHAGGGVHYNAERRVWVVSGHAEVRAAARAHGALSSAEGVTPTRSAVPMMLLMDRPEHARLRRIVAPHFTRDALQRWRPAIEEIAHGACDALPLGAPVDAVGSLAVPVPVDVIAELLGISRADRAAFRAWSEQIVKGFTIAKGSGWMRSSASVMAAVFRLHAYFLDAFDARARAPREDLLSHLASSSHDGSLSEQERFWFALLLLVAGNETTTSLLAGMLHAFAEHPGEYERVREDPSLIGPAVEEALRYTSPIQGFYRTALRDHEVGGATIPAGARVLLLFGAANRDPRKFPEPDRFRVDRDTSDHLAFGSGIHFCLGAHLARIEGAVVLRRLVERASAIELAGRPGWNGNPSVRGLARLPLRLRAAADTGRQA
jgi:cytochrome P450